MKLTRDETLERFRAVMGDIASDGEPADDPMPPLEPLSAPLLARLLEVSGVGGAGPEAAPRASLWAPVRWFLGALAAPAAALGVVVALTAPALPALAPYAPETPVAVLPRAPDGQVVLAGGPQRYAAVGDRRLALRPADTLTVRLRPQRAERGPLTVRAFVRRGPQVRPWGATPERQDDGLFLLQQPVHELGLPAGPSDLLFVVARDGETPTAGQALAAADGLIRARGWRVAVVRVTVTP